MPPHPPHVSLKAKSCNFPNGSAVLAKSCCPPAHAAMASQTEKLYPSRSGSTGSLLSTLHLVDLVSTTCFKLDNQEPKSQNTHHSLLDGALEHNSALIKAVLLDDFAVMEHVKLFCSVLARKHHDAFLAAGVFT